MEIKQDFIQTNQTYRSVLPYYLVVHDTGDPGGTDTNEHDYFAGGNRNASADVFVDKDSITQIINTDIDYSWHCGDGAGVYGIKNSNSMGIEMCLEADGTLSEETIENTLYVVKYFMDKYNIPLERIVRHYDASRKCCPAAMSKNNWAPWYDFKNRLANYSGSGPVISSGNWILEDNKWWYLRANKTYPKDCWELINNKWYLFDASGWMLTDWKSDEGKWYYLGSDGAMKIGWILDAKSNKWYYNDEHGVMQTGWEQVADKWYYLDISGVMQIGWIQDKGNWYCLYSDGSMMHDITAYGYMFNSNGVATKLS